MDVITKRPLVAVTIVADEKDKVGFSDGGDEDINTQKTKIGDP